MRSVVYLSIGSNQGPRRARVLRALRRLRRLPGSLLERSSSLFETAPVDAPGPAFLNAAAKLRTRLSPTGLLTELKRIEASMGRKPGPRGAPRPIDIDILFWGRRRLKTPLLRIPHPRALSRRFVLEPLAELAPGWSPPGSRGRSVRRLAAAGRDTAQEVRPA